MRSYSLHLSGTEEAVGSNEQHKNHYQVGSNRVNTWSYKAGEVVFVPGSQVLYQADNDSTHDCSGNRVNTAQDDGREGQQRSAAQRWIHRKRTNGEKHSSNCGHGGSNPPGQCVDGANVDSHRQRGLLVKRSSAHRQSVPGTLEEIKEDCGHNCNGLYNGLTVCE